MKVHSLVVFLSLLLCGCKEQKIISDFKSDGCSLFPDNSLILEKDWCYCCFKHDMVYWHGGTESERSAADKALRDCVLQKTGNEELAQLMYTGVRFGGSPYFYNWYRWGYGWGYDRKYKELNDIEKKQVALKLEEYFSNNPDHPCNLTTSQIEADSATNEQ